MSIKEVFPNPTVKKVIFQIRFPNLFYLENKIGDFQQLIMKEFPESQLLYRKQIIFADFAPDSNINEINLNQEPNNVKKIWKFISPKNYELNIQTDSLDISSNFHKTYNNNTSENKFRDSIEFVLNSFFKTIKIPIITRLGLRYIDECPIIEKNNKLFKEWYNTTLPINRFKIEDAIESNFRTVTQKGDYFLIFSENLKIVNNEWKLILDFDGYANNINSDNFLKVADDLHSVISNEFKKSIKEPLIMYMRNQ